MKNKFLLLTILALTLAIIPTVLAIPAVALNQTWVNLNTVYASGAASMGVSNILVNGTKANFTANVTGSALWGTTAGEINCTWYCANAAGTAWTYLGDDIVTGAATMFGCSVKPVTTKCSDGSYTINVTLYNQSDGTYLGNNSVVQTNVTIDNTAPTVTISNYLSRIDTMQSNQITCSATDTATATPTAQLIVGVNYTNPLFTATKTKSAETGGVTHVSITGSDNAHQGTAYVDCNASDLVGQIGWATGVTYKIYTQGYATMPEQAPTTSETQSLLNLPSGGLEQKTIIILVIVGLVIWYISSSKKK